MNLFFFKHYVVFRPRRDLLILAPSLNLAPLCPVAVPFSLPARSTGIYCDTLKHFNIKNIFFHRQLRCIGLFSLANLKKIICKKKIIRL